MEIHAWRKVCRSWHQKMDNTMQDFFDRIYVLNLDRRTDRWAGIQKQLHHACITKAVRFPAIDKKPGWMGCLESHLTMLRQALADNVKNLLILEDDAELYPDWIPIWREGSKQIPEDWDMLYLGYNLEPTACVPPTRVSSHMLHLNDALTTHAYAINGKCFEKLIEYIVALVGAGIPIDVIYARNFTNIKAYGIYPMLFRQSVSVSDILGCAFDFPLRQNIDHILAGRR